MKPVITVFFLLAALQAVFAQDVRPNVVFIMADDLGYTDLSCYGNPYHRTPNIDSLAKRGLKFRQAYSACPVCSPSRAAIMTGKHPARLHLTNFIVGDRTDPASPVLPAKWKKYLSPSETTLAEVFKNEGYATGMVGKWHLGTGDSTSPARQGFDYDRVIAQNGLDYYNYTITAKGKTIFEDKGTHYLTDKLTDYAVEYIRENRSKPFFLYLTYSAPHVMLIPRADKLNYYFREYEKHEGKFNPNYGAMLESLDEGVGRVLKQLSESNLLENTVVVFTSDNGGAGLAELGPVPTNLEPLRKWKGHVYEGGIKVPLIVSWPGKIDLNSETDNQVTGTDYFATFADVLGLKNVQISPDGKSFKNVLSNPRQHVDRGAIYWHYPHFSNQLGRPGGAIREGNFKLVELYETGKTELFDLTKDIGEQNDLSSVNPEKAKELKRKTAHMAESSECQYARAKPELPQ